jgi:hypothetical protein
MPTSIPDGASSGSEHRKQPPDIKGSFKYIKYAVVDSRHGLGLCSSLQKWYKVLHRTSIWMDILDK